MSILDRKGGTIDSSLVQEAIQLLEEDLYTARTGQSFLHLLQIPNSLESCLLEPETLADHTGIR